MVASSTQASGFSAGGTKSSWSAVAVRLSGVVVQPTKWLWRGRIPLGKLTLLAGDPGLGKSFLTVDLAARVTGGKAWPDAAPASSGSVIFLNAEDELDDTLCPRLAKAGADLDKCIAVTAKRSGEDGLTKLLSLAKDLAAVRQILLDTPDCKLIVIDPISAYMGYTDSNSNTEVRSLLFPLAQLAAEFQVAVVAVTHLNKRGTGRAIYRAMGSLAFVAAARSAFTVVRDPDDEQRHLLLPVKSNLAMKSSGLAYRFKAESELDVATINWEDEPVVDASLDELLNQRKTLSAADRVYRDSENFAESWLRQELENGPRRRDSFFTLFQRPFEISDQQVYRAADRLGVVKTKESLSNDSWIWSLPDQNDTCMNRLNQKQARDQTKPETREGENAESKLQQAKKRMAKLREIAPRVLLEMHGGPEVTTDGDPEALDILQEARKIARLVRDFEEHPNANVAMAFGDWHTEVDDTEPVAAKRSGSQEDSLASVSVSASQEAAEIGVATGTATAGVRSSGELADGPTTTVERPRGGTTEQKLAPLDERMTAMDSVSKTPLPGMIVDSYEDLLSRLEWRLDRYCKVLERKGRHLNEKSWTNFCAELKPKERGFLDENWGKLQEHFYQLVAKTPLGAAIRKNNGQWPPRRFQDLCRTNQRIETRYRNAGPRTPME